MSAAYKCDFCGKVYEGEPPRVPAVEFAASQSHIRPRRAAIFWGMFYLDWRRVPGVPDEAGKRDTCPRCQQAILRLLADAVEVVDG